MSTRLSQLRDHLSRYKTDLQRTYRWKFTSTKLLIGRSDLLITAIDHPYFNYTNEGDYRGFISKVTKPSEVSITFLETDRHQINSMLELWDSIKYNKATGILYPKACYEDQGILTYLGDHFDPKNPSKVQHRARRYELLGFYPINRSPINLNYGSNDVVTLQVNFNIDDIKSVAIESGGLSSLTDAIKQKSK